MTDSFEIHCNYCNGNFIQSEPDENWICICQKKPKTMKFTSLLKCQEGHRNWIHSRNADCPDCQNEKMIKTAKKLLAIQSDPKRQAIEQSIVETNRIFHNNKTSFFKKKMLVDSSLIEIPNLLKELIQSVDSMKKDNDNSKKLDDLGYKLKDLESKFVQ